MAILPISTISFDSSNINGAIQQQAAVGNSSSSRISNNSNNSYSEKRDRSRTYSRSIKKLMTIPQTEDRIQQLKDEIGYPHNEIDGLNGDITDIKSKHLNNSVNECLLSQQKIYQFESNLQLKNVQILMSEKTKII